MNTIVVEQVFAYIFLAISVVVILLAVWSVRRGLTPKSLLLSSVIFALWILISAVLLGYANKDKKISDLLMVVIFLECGVVIYAITSIANLWLFRKLQNKKKPKM